MWVLIIRYFGASMIALPLKLMRDPLPFDGTSMKSYLAGSLNLIGAQLFIYLAANYLTSGLMALIFGFSPLIAGLIGHVILTHAKIDCLTVDRDGNCRLQDSPLSLPTLPTAK